MGKETEGGDELRTMASDARKYVWMGAIPLLVNLHSSEVTSLPAPSPFLVLAPRNGYLPLLADSVRPHFLSSLPPGSDTIWFDYEGLPLKWHIPTGVLYDLLCAEPERPWKLTVHFRAYPSDVLTPCETEEAVKWGFINAMKEASYVMYGSTKSVMNMSQVDQFELWRSVVKGDLENFDHISARLRPGSGSSSGRPPLRRVTSAEAGADSRNLSRLGSEVVLPGRIPMRLYIRRLLRDRIEDLDDLCDVPTVVSWDELVHMTRPIESPKEQGLVLTLRDALIKVVPHLFSSVPSARVVAKTETPSDVHGEEGHEIEGSDLHVRRSYSDVIQGKGEAEETGTAATAEATPQSRRNSESDHLTAPQHGGSAEEGHADRDPEEAAPEPVSSGGEGEKATSRSSGGVQEEGLHPGGSQRELNGFVRIQGIQPNLDIPFDWVARNLCGPEQFIHVCICTWVAL